MSWGRKSCRRRLVWGRKFAALRCVGSQERSDPLRPMGFDWFARVASGAPALDLLTNSFAICLHLCSVLPHFIQWSGVLENMRSVGPTPCVLKISGLCCLYRKITGATLTGIAKHPSPDRRGKSSLRRAASAPKLPNGGVQRPKCSSKVSIQRLLLRRR